MNIEPSELKEPPQWLTQVKEHIDKQYCERLFLADLAAIADVHPVYLARVFRSHYGLSINKYLLGLRLEHARKLLGSGEMPLSDIAAETGFCDQGHFSKNFKRFYGVSPGEYRKAVQSR
ncbi:MAG TPA: AraC family transcriptional regulator [Blastocatellia bacterium]|nr:AraC family transcriptional regulator [Blastocatellia bacterium]